MEDLTYLPCLEQTIYLNTIVDYFNAEIHAYRFSEFINAKLFTDTFRDVGDVLEVTDGVILYSDGSTTLYRLYINSGFLQQETAKAETGLPFTSSDQAPEPQGHLFCPNL
jgi:hypothetical protein